MEFLTNAHLYENIKVNDEDQFSICKFLLLDSLRKQQRISGLVHDGNYDEAANLLRHVMESTFHVRYLAKNPSSWRQWINQQDYAQKKIIGKAQDPGTVFGEFSRLLSELKQSTSYPLFRKLCSWSHPGIEVIRSAANLHPSHYTHYYVPRYNKERAEELLNLLYMFINDAMWDGLKHTFAATRPLPKNLERYREIQQDATHVFDLVYEPSVNS